jgi:hypothetical protein
MKEPFFLAAIESFIQALIQGQNRRSASLNAFDTAAAAGLPFVSPHHLLRGCLCRDDGLSAASCSARQVAFRTCLSSGDQEFEQRRTRRQSEAMSHRGDAAQDRLMLGSISEMVGISAISGRRGICSA